MLKQLLGITVILVATVSPLLGTPLVTVSQSQGLEVSTVCGYVLDPLGDPIYGALVEVTNSTVILYNVTASDGYYCFPNLSPGNYTVMFKKYGMETITYDIEVVDSRIAVLNDNTGNITNVLSSKGYAVTNYIQLNNLLTDIGRYRAIILNRFQSIPSNQQLLQLLETANTSRKPLIFLDTNSSVVFFGGANTPSNYAIHILNYKKSVVESAGFPAPDSISEGATGKAFVYVKVTNTSDPAFTNITYDYPFDSNSFYLVDQSASNRAYYAGFDFSEASVHSLADLVVNGTVVGSFAAYWQTPSGVRWYFISVGPSPLITYSPGSDGVYDRSAIDVLVNAVEAVAPIPHPLGNVTMQPAPGTYVVTATATISYDYSRVKAYLRLENVSDSTAEWLTTPDKPARMWLPEGSYTLVARNPVYGEAYASFSVPYSDSVSAVFNGKRIAVIGDWRTTLIDFLNRSVGEVVDAYDDIVEFNNNADPTSYSAVIVNAWYNPYSGQAPSNYLDQVVALMDASYDYGFTVLFLDTWFMLITPNGTVIDDVTGVQALYKFRNDIPYQYGYAAPAGRNQDYEVGEVFIVINSSSPVFTGIGDVGDKVYVNTDQDRQDFAWVGNINAGSKVAGTQYLAIVGADNLPNDNVRWGVVEIDLNNVKETKWFYITFAADMWPGEDYSDNGAYTDAAKKLILNALAVGMGNEVPPPPIPEPWALSVIVVLITFVVYYIKTIRDRQP